MVRLNGIMLSIATLLVAGPALAAPTGSIIDQFEATGPAATFAMYPRPRPLHDGRLAGRQGLRLAAGRDLRRGRARSGHDERCGHRMVGSHRGAGSDHIRRRPGQSRRPCRRRPTPCGAAGQLPGGRSAVGAQGQGRSGRAGQEQGRGRCHGPPVRTRISDEVGNGFRDRHLGVCPERRKQGVSQASGDRGPTLPSAAPRSGRALPCRSSLRRR